MKIKAENRLANEKESDGKETEVFIASIYLNIESLSILFVTLSCISNNAVCYNDICRKKLEGMKIWQIAKTR